RKRGIADTALVRVERLYPLPAEEIVAALASYPGAGDLVWAQEEAANMGAWSYIALHLPERLSAAGDPRTLRRVSRPASASPAVGSSRVHETEQAALIEATFGA
ncbi:MAG: hypothetical protein ACM3ZF_10645, partial [Mycobacterium leprae]